MEKGVIYGTGVYQSGEVKGKKVMQESMTSSTISVNSIFQGKTTTRATISVKD